MDGTGIMWADGSRSSLHRRSDDGGDSRRTVDAEPPSSESFASILVADARLDGEPLALDRTLDEIPDATVRPENHTVSSSGSRTLFSSVAGASKEAVDQALTRDESVVDATHVATFPDCLTYRLELTDDTILVAPTSLEFGVRAATVRGYTGQWRARLHFPDRDALVALRTYCTDRDISFGIDSLYQTSPFDDSTSGLTDRQRNALTTAFEMGYYNSPRGATQDDVAARLGISTSAISQLLRRATAQLIDETF